MTNYDSQFDRMFAHFDTLEAKIGGLNAKIGGLNAEIGGLNTKIGGLNAEIGGLNAKINEQSLQINEQSLQITGLNETISGLNAKIDEQSSIIEKQAIRILELETELVVVKQRVTRIEDRLDILDKQLSTFAPFFRSLLEEEGHLILEPGYFTEMRDKEAPTSFDSAHDILLTEPDYDSYLGHYANPHGAAISFGQRVSQFYQSVTAHKPRQFGNTFKYWLEAEALLVENVLRLWRTIH